MESSQIATMSIEGFSIWAIPLEGKPHLVITDDDRYHLGRFEFAVGDRRLYVNLGSSESDVFTMELSGRQPR